MCNSLKNVGSGIGSWLREKNSRSSAPNPAKILELPNHPFYVGVQFHPEFKSRPARPSTPFLDTGKGTPIYSVAVRSCKPPEVYKGKGIMYIDEVIKKKKQGKKSK